MTALACHETRCTSKIAPKQAHVELRLHDEPAVHFCSVTCCWSWLNAHVEEKHRLQGMSVLKEFTFERQPDPKFPKSAIKMEEETKTYAPGEYKLNYVPDEAAKVEIADILATSIRGPYRFVTDSWLPYVRVEPSDSQIPITIRSSQRLHLAGPQSRTLVGLDDTMDFAIQFVGSHIELRGVLSVPGKALRGQKMLDGIEGKR